MISDDDARAETLVAGSATTQTRDDSTTGQESRSAAEVPPPPEIGRYKLIARLGAGAMGVVWSAVDPQLERKVAIKVVHPRLATSPEASLRMLREARAMAKLAHPAVVTVHDAGDIDGSLFLAMELIDGETLTARLARPDLAPASAWRARLALVLEAGRGLAAAHAAGVLHRDFKPDNVLVDRATGRVAVGDFGLATLGDAAPAWASRIDMARMTEVHLTTTGALLGTPAYMAPEQLRGAPADARTDQFALCVATYEALYGARPFIVTERGLDAIPTLLARIDAGLLAAPPDASLVPAAVRDVLRRGLARDPAARWPDVSALLAALDAASGLRARRRRRGRIAIAAACVAVLAAAGGAWIHAQATPPRPSVLRPLSRAPADAHLELGPDGKMLAVGGTRLVLYEDYERMAEHPWTLDLANGDRTWAIEVEADEVHYSTFNDGPRRTWKFREPPPAPIIQPVASPLWTGSLGDGDLFVDGRGDDMHALRFERAGVMRWTRPFDVQNAAVSARAPDGAHYAFRDHAHDRIAVIDAEGRELDSQPIVNLTAVTWADPHTVVYAVNTYVHPTVIAVPFDDDTGFGVPRALYTHDAGWFVRLAARAGHIVLVDGDPVSHARVLASGTGNRDFEAARAAAAIGWTPDGDLLVWNSGTHLVQHERREVFEDTAIRIATEPANATFAGDTLIVAQRDEAWRDLVAYDTRSGRQLWRRDHELWAVRCTDDRAPPCVALREDHRHVVDIDPATGALGAVRAETPVELEDVALRADGHMLAGGASNRLFELGADGRQLSAIRTPLATLRSVADDGSGGAVLAGTVHASTYSVGRLAGETFAPMMTTDAEIMLLARPDPTHTRVSVTARTISTELSELVQP